MQAAAGGRGQLANCIGALGKLARWPAAQLFPVLDIFRLLVLNAGNARLLAYDAGEFEVCADALILCASGKACATLSDLQYTAVMRYIADLTDLQYMICSAHQHVYISDQLLVWGLMCTRKRSHLCSWACSRCIDTMRCRRQIQAWEA